MASASVRPRAYRLLSYELYVGVPLKLSTDASAARQAYKTK